MNQKEEEKALGDCNPEMTGLFRQNYTSMELQLSLSLALESLPPAYLDLWVEASPPTETLSLWKEAFFPSQ